jgi:hypothetical protein
MELIFYTLGLTQLKNKIKHEKVYHRYADLNRLGFNSIDFSAQLRESKLPYSIFTSTAFSKGC